jgi:hypothetical protein
MYEVLLNISALTFGSTERLKDLDIKFVCLSLYVKCFVQFSHMFSKNN